MKLAFLLDLILLIQGAHSESYGYNGMMLVFEGNYNGVLHVYYSLQ